MGILTDYRSDTVTQPSNAMKQAMVNAELGDDVYGDDPTVNRLEAYIAERSGMEAAVFCPSGTQSNLVALMAHCGRGDEYIVGQEAHTYKYEGGGAAVLGSIQPQPLEFEADSTLDLSKVKAKIKPDDHHYARTRLLCLENTRAGEVLPLPYHAQAAEFCSDHGIKLHMDGARLFNACVKDKVSLETITRHYASVSLCLSKGLGAPAGSVLVGDKALVQEARKWRKMLGGGMRQSGMLAAACLYALEHHVDDLQQDHDNAATLAQGLSAQAGITCDASIVQTNMVYLTLDNAADDAPLRAYLQENGIIWPDGQVKRLVTHRDISPQDIQVTLQTLEKFFNQ
jgi:threonine aldolase